MVPFKALSLIDFDATDLSMEGVSGMVNLESLTESLRLRKEPRSWSGYPRLHRKTSHSLD